MRVFAATTLLLLANSQVSALDGRALAKELRRSEDEAAWQAQADDEIEDEYLVDNSELHHRGPGVLFRKSKSKADIVSKDQYASWGTTVSGIAVGDGWVKVGQYFLPVQVQDATVLVRQESTKQRTRTITTYDPTEVQMPDGSWVPANITGPGRRPRTWDILVIPRTLFPYPMESVPEKQLGKIMAKHVQQRVSTSPRPGQEPDDGRLAVQVEDFVGTTMPLRIPKEETMLSMMEMACELVSIPAEQCATSVKFVHKGRQIKESDTVESMELERGETIYMLRKRKLPHGKNF